MSAPRQIGRFTVNRAIAAGGMAEVYEVVDPHSGEHYALKLLIAVDVALDRFNREYEAMTRLNHPGIVRVYHYGVHEGHPWFTMELLNGAPAQPWMKRIGKPGTPKRTEEVYRMGFHLARALAYAHDRGLIHRDLKSANVLVLPDARVKLVDFGTAHLENASRKITEQGEFVGTYAYASPEQVSARPIDARSDLYSFGVLLFRLATGKRPFSSNDPAALVRAHLSTAPPDPRSLQPSLPEAFSELVLSMMGKKPADRPATAWDVADALEQIHGRSFASTSPLALHRNHATGRDDLRRQANDVLTQQSVATVLVIGEEGSDRSRLTDLLLQDGIEREETVFFCQLKEGDDVRALLAMLKTMTHQASSSLKAVRNLRRLAAANSTQLAMNRIRRGLNLSVLGTLKALGPKPILVGVHGMEHASPLTLEVLASLRASAEIEGIHVRLVADASAGSFQRGTDLSRRFPDALCLRVDPLGPRDIARSVGLMLGRRPPPASLAQQIYEVTDGQPLFVEEAVRSLVRTGTLEADDGNRLEWASGVVDLEPPKSAAAAAGSTLRHLPLLHRRVLEAIALADEEVPTDVISTALEWEEDELTPILDELVSSNLLERTSLGVTWRTGRLREQVVEQIPRHRRTAHERRLTVAMHPHAPTPAQIRLLLATGHLEHARRRCVAVASAALQEADYTRALAILTPVQDQEEGLSGPEVDLLFAQCLQVLKPMDARATKALGRASQAQGQPLFDARLHLVRAQQAERIGHQQNHAKFLSEAWSQAETADDPRLTVEIALAHATTALRQGRMREAGRWIERSRKAAFTAGAMAMGSTVLANARWQLRQGFVVEAEKEASKSVQFFQRAHLSLGAWKSTAVWATALRWLGRWSEANQVLAAALPKAREAQDPSVYVECLLAAAWCEVELSRLGRAQELVDELAATLRRGELPALALEAKLVHGRILLASGQLTYASFVLHEAHERAKKSNLTILSEAARALWAETLVALGDKRADDAFRLALLGLKGSGDRLAHIDALVARARSIRVGDDVDDLFRPARKLEGSEDLPVWQIEEKLAHATLASHAENTTRAAQMSTEAARSMNRLSTQLDDIDRAALRVHPWSQRIRVGLRATGD